MNRDLLALTLTPGVGPVICARLIEAFGSAAKARGASSAQLERVRGIGPKLADQISAGLAKVEPLVAAELELAAEAGVDIVGLGDERYPPLLAQVPSPPPVLYVKGEPRWSGPDRYTVAVVGSRECTHYGIEQAERFAGVLAGAGLTVVSGGARGIDSAAHRAALRAGGRTVAVLGCGLSTVYPRENADLFSHIAGGENGGPAQGCLVSELPLRTAPAAENFPARNRIISGLSLGVLVIEAGARSGALITAKLAADDHGREVMALPGRVDSPASAGTLGLIRDGEAMMVLEPGDVLRLLESPARHLHGGTHEARFGASGPTLFDGGSRTTDGAGVLSEAQRSVLEALDQARTPDEIAAITSFSPDRVRVELTMLEIQGRVKRRGTVIERRTV